MNERTHVDLFTGIGGFALAASSNGVRTVAMCECDSNCRKFLRQAWGLAPFPDVRKFKGRPWRGCWLLTAGVPCQPASRAGQQRGAEDDRWLWPEAIRVATEARPTWLLFENPPGILDVGLDGILADLERLGYEVQPISIPACAVNSPQDRERIWIVGHREKSGQGLSAHGLPTKPTQSTLANGKQVSLRRKPKRLQRRKGTDERTRITSPVAASPWSDFEWLECPNGKGNTVVRRAPIGLYRMAHGLPSRLPRGMGAKLIAALGNSIVWPLASEIIAAMIGSEL